METGLRNDFETAPKDGWREWNGRYRPVALGDNTLIDVRAEDGRYYPHQPASNYSWDKHCKIREWRLFSP